LRTTQIEFWFDAFWQLYPRHVGKASALKAWKKAATSEAIKDEIMDGFSKQVTSLILAGKFCPHASTWLNGRRWEDEDARNHAYVAAKLRVIACQLCGDTGTIGSFPDADTMALEPCSCARGAVPGLMVGVYRVSTGERLDDAQATPTSGDGAAGVSA
jgi:hypothetical protein